MPVEIQVQIDRSGYYLGTAMLLFVVLLWILVRLSPSPLSPSRGQTIAERDSFPFCREASS